MSGRQSRHVQEPLRKKGNMYAFIEEQNKIMGNLCLTSFSHVCLQHKLTELVKHGRKLRQFLN